MFGRSSSSAVAAASLRENATHLVVFQHGLWGNEKDFRNFQTLFTQYFPQDEIYAHVSQCNATALTQLFRTYDGIDTGGERLATETLKLANQMPKLAKFSIVGHSLGGLYARYCIGVLLSKGFFDKVEPMNFITLATPHMGIRRTERAPVNVVHNSIAPLFFDLTGQQFTLKDTASDATIALSRSVRRDAATKPAFVDSRMESVALVRVPVETKGESVDPVLLAEARAFQLIECKLDDGILRLFREQDAPEVVDAEGVDAKDQSVQSTLDKSVCVAEIDMLEATVTIIIPERNKPATGSKRRLSAPPETASAVEDGASWDFEINCPASEPNTIGKQYTIRIPQEELQTQWKWIAALSNASHGVFCRSQSDTGSSSPPKTTPAPTLLSCLTRGHFIQALQLFRARTLYSSIYNDFQVPYSLGAIRAFNPYRLETNPANEATSPYYRHIVMRSLWNAPLLRDTLPEDARALSDRATMSGRFSLVKMLSDRHNSSRRRPTSSASLHQSFSIFGRTESSGSRSTRSHTTLTLSGPSSASSQSLRPPSSSSSSSSSLEVRIKNHTVTGSNEIVSASVPEEDESEPPSSRLSMFTSPFSSSESARPVPFEDGLLLLDHANHAFETDDFRDDLRGMMVSLQSVGWRRIDVFFQSPMAHMKIIAMTANPTKPLTKGLDVVHHVMDTFLL